MPVVKIPQTPLSESNGSMGHHVETPRKRSTSSGQVEQPAIPMIGTTNGVTFVVPPGANEPQ